MDIAPCLAVLVEMMAILNIDFAESVRFTAKKSRSGVVQLPENLKVDRGRDPI